MNSQREHAQQLLQHLGPAQVAAVVHLMEVMLDPFSRKLAHAPYEDEEVSEGEEVAVREAREWAKHNKSFSNEDVLAEFGLTLGDFERMAQTPLPGETDRSG